MECELCNGEAGQLQYDQDSLIKHLLKEHLVKRQTSIEDKVETIKDLQNQLTDKDKEHGSNINALSTKLKTAEETVTAMNTEIEQKKATFVDEEKKVFKCEMCDSQFTSNQTLKKHFISDHDTNKKHKFETENKEAEKQKHFSCEIHTGFF